MINCSRCNEENPDNAITCQSCGETLKRPNNQSNSSAVSSYTKAANLAQQESAKPSDTLVQQQESVNQVSASRALDRKREIPNFNTEHPRSKTLRTLAKVTTVLSIVIACILAFTTLFVEVPLSALSSYTEKTFSWVGLSLIFGVLLSGIIIFHVLYGIADALDLSKTNHEILADLWIHQ